MRNLIAGRTGACGSPESVHEHWMREALTLARQAGARGEVPVGAVAVVGGECVGRGRNGPIATVDPTAHAEMQALRMAGRAMGNYRLPAATLYVTVEPCAMCAGAMVHARIEHLVYGAAEPKWGAVASTARLFELPGINRRPEVTAGVLADECAQLLIDFFEARRTS